VEAGTTDWDRYYPDPTGSPVAAHPLAEALAARLATQPDPRVLLLGIGSGRNVGPFVRAGVRVHAVEQDVARAEAAKRAFVANDSVCIECACYGGPFPERTRVAGALSTHALLHGTPAAIAAAVQAVRERLETGGSFFVTLGSVRDPRFGRGTRIAEGAFAPSDGSEAGVTHSFFDEAGVRSLFSAFELEGAYEDCAAATVGTWAHEPDQARDIVHWYVKARLPEDA